MVHLLTVETSEDGTEVHIHADVEGLRILRTALDHLARHVVAGETGHAHMMTPDWGGTELSNARQDLSARLVHHIQLHGWPKVVSEGSRGSDLEPWPSDGPSLGPAGSLTLMALSDDRDGVVLTLGRLGPELKSEDRVATIRFLGVASYTVTDETWCHLRAEREHPIGAATIYEQHGSRLVRDIAKGGAGVPVPDLRHWLVLTENEWIDVVARDASLELFP